MQDIEQNMDDLLRRAAANYPLAINESDWEAIASRLSTAAETPAAARRWTRFLPGLLMLLFLFTAGTFVRHEPRGIKLATAVTNEPVTTVTTVTSKTLEAPRNLIERPGHSSFMQQPSPQEHNVHITHGMTVEQRAKADINVPSNIETKSSWPVDSTVDPQPQSLKKRGRFYVGIIVGQESNRVKETELCNRGFDAGLIIGYKLNQRFSLETGLLFNKKDYFCNGDDFNMEMPGMKLESLEGSSNMLEIPLKLRYDVIQKRSWNVFSTAGISSYILTNEKNNYLLVVNGVRQNMISKYEKNSKYFAGAVGLSVGYEYKASPRLRLRLQPYLQIPLKGMGVGSIPVQSMGVHAGITYSSR